MLIIIGRSEGTSRSDQATAATRDNLEGMVPDIFYWPREAAKGVQTVGGDLKLRGSANGRRRLIVPSLTVVFQFPDRQTPSKPHIAEGTESMTQSDQREVACRQ